MSSYYWRNKNNKFDDFDSFISTLGFNNIQSYSQYSINNIVAVDKIYKYEELNEAMLDISRKIGLNTTLELPIYQAKSDTRKIKNYKDFLDEKSIKQIKIVCAREIELLNYAY